MGLHFWLIPLVAILAVAVVIFYFIIKRTGGPGVRGTGRTMVDKPEEEPKSNAGWNYYR